MDAGRTPEDLRGIVVFLASPASDYINGYTIASTAAGWRASPVTVVYCHGLRRGGDGGF